MSSPRQETDAREPLLGARNVEEDLAPWEEDLYRRIVSQDIEPALRERLATPPCVQRGQRSLFAVHWHPEFVPLDIIRERLAAAFPDAEDELVIPTQHNILLTWDEFAGVEVDCFAPEFGRKVQLLLHVRADRVSRADRLLSMLAYTYRYRASQLFSFLEALTEPGGHELRNEAADETGTAEELVHFVQVQARKLAGLIDRFGDETPKAALRNKLVRSFFDGLRGRYRGAVVNSAQAFVREVKRRVKEAFDPEYFYDVREIIEETRGLEGGVVVPHPEQFWPILLADYDVDGIEVWNPQSRMFTEFLIRVVHRKNRERRRGEKLLLVTMGDDCHMGDKAREPGETDPEKACREIGVQPWEDLSIRKSLMRGGMDRATVLGTYRDRLR